MEECIKCIKNNYFYFIIIIILIFIVDMSPMLKKVHTSKCKNMSGN